MSRARVVIVLSVTAVALMTSAAAFAAWSASSSGAGAARAKSLTAPLTVEAAPTSGSTTTSITISVIGGPAASSATPSGYRVDRVHPAGTACVITGATGTCDDVGRTASTTYDYQVFSLIGSNLAAPSWTSADDAAASATTDAAAATLTITGVARSGGNKKVAFSGTGAAAGTTITVTICAVNSFPCASPPAGTSLASNPTAGNWTSAQSGPNNLAATGTYYAQAVQGSSTSAVFEFKTDSLS